MLVAGKDPLWEVGGHSGFVRAHARAAVRAGFEPHLFAVSERTRTVTTPYGVVHLLASPVVRLLGWRARGASVAVPILARAVEGFVRSLGAGSVALHGFAYFGAAAVTAARVLRGQGLPARAAVSMYGAVGHEYAAIRAGWPESGGVGPRLRRLLAHLVSTWELPRLERRACEGASLVLVNHDSVERLLRRAYRGLAPLRRLPLAAESAFEDTRPPSRPSTAVPVVVTVARHDPRKRLDVLLQALARLAHRGVPFRAVLVGGGPLLAEHRGLAARLGLAGQVELPGEVPDPRPFLQAGDVFALPSAEEGGGSLAVLEALQTGLPVVASAVDGLAEDVDHGESGYLVPAADPVALADALERLLGAPGLRDRMGHRARRVFEQRFTADLLATALRHLYRELTRAPRAGGVSSFRS